MPHRLVAAAVRAAQLPAAAGLLAFVPSSAFAASEIVRSQSAAFVVETFAEGFENPWGMVKLPDGRFLVTERPGRIRIVSADGQVDPEPLSGVPPVRAVGQGGLLDIELHPDYAANGWIYIAWSKPFGEKRDRSLTAIGRGRLDGHALTDFQTVFDPPEEQATRGGVHFGCRIEFDSDNNLYFAIGDRGGPTNPSNPAQALDNIKGKSLRIADDGAIPPDNPFVKVAGAHPALWTYGNRNIQGMRFQPGSSDLWATEHGPRGGDELNLLASGVNYGWPIVTNGINYRGTPITDLKDHPDMTLPVVDWTPSIAVCGIDFYTGEMFPDWKGDLFVAALATQKVVRVDFQNGRPAGQEDLLQGSGRIRDVRCFGDGPLYVIYDEPGKIVRLTSVTAP